MIMKTVFWTFLLFTSLGVLHSHESEKHCTASNVDFFPKNKKIYLLGNSTLELECRINDTNLCRSKDITFWYKIKVDGLELKKSEQNKVDDKYVESNESTVRIRIPLEENVYHFICKYNEDSIHTFMVCVGHPPEEVNFTCISRDYEELSCSFPEVSNPAVPKYSVKYSVATRVPSAESKNNSRYSKCSLSLINSVYHCNISIFRKFWNYLFEIKISNKFGVRTQEVYINPRTIAIPKRPEIKNTTNITSRNANLTWQLSTNFNNYDLPFIHRVSVKSKYADFEDHDLSELITNRVDGHHVLSILLNLPYAYTWYDVRVYTRVKEALYGDALWSNFSSTAFQTLPRTPDSPPKIDVGGFQKIDNELKIFWKELADSERNGANLTYEVVEVLENDVIKHTRIPKKPITKSMARFSDTRPDIKYTFKIISKNAQGRSLNTSVIVVPRQSDCFKFPFNLKKILNNRQYTLTWDPPHDPFDLIQDYTIFWCDPQDEQPDLCDTEFDFKRIHRSETNFTYAKVLEKQTIFAISANTNNSSSGMIWFQYSANNNGEVSTVKVFFGLIFFVFIIYTVIYGLIQSVKKFKKMKDIGIVIPPGLEDIIKSPERTKSKINNDDSDMNKDEQTWQLLDAIQKSNSIISFENKGGLTNKFKEPNNQNCLLYEQILNPEYEPIDQNSPILCNNNQRDHNNLNNLTNHRTVQRTYLKNSTSSNDGKIIGVPFNADQPIKIIGDSGELDQRLAPPENPITSYNYVSPNLFLKPVPIGADGVGSSVGIGGYVAHDTMKQKAQIPLSGYTLFSAVMNTNMVLFKRCQGLDHAQKYCHKEIRCVKCLKRHLAKDCKKPEQQMPKCVNCGKEDPANYRGCLVSKTLPKTKSTKRKKIIQIHKPKKVHRSVEPGLTHANVVNPPAPPENTQDVLNEKLKTILQKLNTIDERLKQLEYSSKGAISKTLSTK